ncbi:hypothetical protein RvY_08762 [Ramazzottius varieornatus]|uniref:Uncharacterized protein n=1 Tax=Ramazzottius varieornatus TaxID=947166 RepID=A0A1D1V722_RAMVA|nr:hypothetical protein RvY_08762 [Ramazzottius varieornatus]
MPGSNDEDIIARVIEFTSSVAASTSGDAGKREFRCKLCGHSEHARYAIHRHVRHQHADQLRPLEAAVRPQQYFRLGREQRMQTQSFAGAEMNMVKLSSPAATPVEDSELRRFIEFETLSNINNRVVQSEKLFVCLPCKESVGRTLAYTSSEWGHIEAHLRSEHPSAIKRQFVKPAPLAPKKAIPLMTDKVDALELVVKTESPTRIRQLNSNFITFEPGPEGNEEMCQRSPAKFFMKVAEFSQHEKDLDAPTLSLRSVLSVQGKSSADLSTSNMVVDPQVDTPNAESNKKSDVRASLTSSSRHEVILEPKHNDAVRVADNEDATGVRIEAVPWASPKALSAGATKLQKVLKRDKPPKTLLYKSHRETRAEEKKHYRTTRSFPKPEIRYAQVPDARDARAYGKSLAAQVFSMSIDSCKNQGFSEAESTARNSRDKRRDSEEKEDQITWLTVREVAEMQKAKTFADQIHALTSEGIGRTREQHNCSGEKVGKFTSLSHRFPPSVQERSGQPSEKKGFPLGFSTSFKTQPSQAKEAGGASDISKDGQFPPDAAMDVNMDIKERSILKTVSGAPVTESQGLYSAHPIDEDQVRYLQLCSRMSGIASKDFYVHLTKENFEQAEKDVILFRRSLGFDTAFEWPEDKA